MKPAQRRIMLLTFDGVAPALGSLLKRSLGGPELTALLISNLQDQFGLRLASTTGSVEYWVVDHVEPPGDD
jgi:hypothetical protein